VTWLDEDALMLSVVAEGFRRQLPPDTVEEMIANERSLNLELRAALHKLKDQNEELEWKLSQLKDPLSSKPGP
jgi:hypothetical protein